MSQLVGLIHPYPIDHLATVLGHDVVQVKDDFRLWALFLDLQLIGRGHVDLQAASVQAVAAFYELGWHTVKSIDKMRLRARVAEPDWSTIRYLAMDEFALHKGHRYVVEGRHGLYAGGLQQLLAGLGKPLRHPLVAAQPVQLLQPRCAAAFAPDSASRHVQHQGREKIGSSQKTVEPWRTIA